MINPSHTSMVERVARAIYATMSRRPASWWDRPGISSDHQLLCRSAARAAIAAMHAPPVYFLFDDASKTLVPFIPKYAAAFAEAEGKS